MRHILYEVGLEHFHGIKFLYHLVEVGVHIIRIGILMVFRKPDGEIPFSNPLKSFDQVLDGNQKTL